MYDIFLSNGMVHRGDDERDVEEMLSVIVEPDDASDLPGSWVWLAGLYVRRQDVIALTVIQPR